jgi:uroporphyrinogen III methyltransferase/synthase
VHGVRSFFTRLRAGGRDARHLGTARLAAIGPATAREVAAQGCACDLVPDEHRSEGVVLALGQTVRDGRFLLVRANRGRDLMRRELESLGHSVTEVAAYASTAVPTITPDLLAAIDRGGIDWITLTSSYIAETAVRLFGTRLQRWKVASISPVTTAALKSIGLTPTAEARYPTAAGLVEAMAEWESLQGGFMGAAQPAKPEQPPSPADSPS